MKCMYIVVVRYEYLSDLEGTPVMLEFLFPTKLDFWPLYTF